MLWLASKESDRPFIPQAHVSNFEELQLLRNGHMWNWYLRDDFPLWGICLQCRRKMHPKLVVSPIYFEIGSLTRIVQHILDKKAKACQKLVNLLLWGKQNIVNSQGIAFY
jgi:hypothetical protein